MMRLIASLIATTAFIGAAQAETYEIQMRNKGGTGTMVFEPAFLAIQPGDTVKFIAIDKGHDAETIEGMIPEGAEPFKGKANEEIEVTFTVEGVYGIKCNPHYAMGMVALIEVGAPTNLEAAEAVVQKGKAKTRFPDLFAQVTE
ncbi:MAG: pseudoazurin [Deltaproteobacteria bacterium]